MVSKSDDAVGKSSSSENNGGKSGVSIRQGVIMAVIAYTAITALLLGRAYRNRSLTVTHNSQFLISIHDRTVSNALSEDRPEEDMILTEEEPERVVVEDGSNSSAVGVRLATALGEDKNSENNNDEDISEDANEEDWRDRLYHSSVVFGLNYEEMISSFKVFVYARGDHAFAALSGSVDGDEIRYIDDIFFQTLYQSDFVTDEPEKAHLYFIPISIRALWNDERVGPLKMGRFLNKYIQGLRDDFPYWQRTLGADHAMVVCHDYKEDGSRNVLELKKNVIQVSCSPLAGAQTFFPHKDFAIPPFRRANDPSGTRDVESSERTKLVYHSGRDLKDLTGMWDGDLDFLLQADDVAADIDHKHLVSSKYCLISVPEDTSKIVDALRFGCVPVIVSDGRMYDLPYQDILNWNEFTVVLSVKNLKNLKGLLQDMSQEQYKRMQILGLEASKHMQWHTPPQDQDAFYMALYDLWIRRHAIRYVEREDLQHNTRSIGYT
ncbi:hypothetical protein Mapa_011120 [Marchantia paleacea]|nr:hypothetical protein Mapa_011120 [Marchantia paleacea]